METLIKQLDDFNFEDLLYLRIHLEAKLEEVIEDKNIKHITERVELDGYYCTRQQYAIPQVNRIALPYYLKVYTHDKEDKTDVKVSDVHDKQKDWVKLFEFDYQPTDKDNFEPVGEWDYSDWDDPATCKGVMNVYLYYKPQPCPPEGTTFKGLYDGEGMIETWKISNGFVCQDDVEYASIASWDSYGLFIIPDDLL